MFNILALNLPTNIEAAGEQVINQMVSTSFVGDLLIMAVMVIVIIIYGFLLDSHNILINLISTYLAWLVVSFFPYEQWVQKAVFLEEWWFKLILILAVIVGTSIILSTSGLFRLYYQKRFLRRWFQAIISGILYTGLLAVILLSVIPQVFLTQFSERTLNIFTSEIGIFSWIILPIAGLFFMRIKRRGPGRPAY